MTEETEYQKLKRSIAEWRSARGELPSAQRVLDAAERELARMPQPVTGYLVCWLERRGNDRPELNAALPVASRAEAEQIRTGVLRWTTSEPKIVEVTIDYTPPSRSRTLEQP